MADAKVHVNCALQQHASACRLTALMQPRCSTQVESFTDCFDDVAAVQAQLCALWHGNSICVLHRYMQIKLPKAMSGEATVKCQVQSEVWCREYTFQSPICWVSVLRDCWKTLSTEDEKPA